MRQLFRSRVRGISPSGGRHGARRDGECVSTFGFHPGSGEVNRQAGLPPPCQRRTAFAARRAGAAIAFLLTICVGAVVQVLEQRRQVVRDARQAIEALADQITFGLEYTGRDLRGNPNRNSAALERIMPAWAATADRVVLLADADGAIIASYPNDPQKLGRPILDLLGPTQPLTTFGAAAGTLEITLPDGVTALATVRGLRNPLGAVAVVQTASDALANWRASTALTITLSATTGFVVLILGFAFHWQATRAREADLIYDTVRGRIDTALNRGRCGLWDWDLARGRVFWSRSMFDLLGLPARNDLLSFGELNALVHPDDIDSTGLRPQLADSEVQLDRSCVSHAACRRPLALAAGTLRIGASGRRNRAASDRHCGRRDRSRSIWWSRRSRPICGCATPSRPFRKPSSCGTPTIGWCCATRSSRNCTACPMPPSMPARLTKPWSRPGTSRSCAPTTSTRTASRKARGPSRRNSPTAAGCISASGAPRTAATFRSAPTSPRSSSTSKS